MPAPCKVTCTRGQWCSQEACNPCPAGHYQDEPVHRHTKCKRWTYKPRYLNFVTKTPGTLRRDVEWTCKKGYELFQYTPGEFECRKIVTTLSTGTTTLTAPTTTEYRESTSHTPKMHSTRSVSEKFSGENDHFSLKIGILLSLSVLGLLGLFSFLVFWALKRWKRKRDTVRVRKRRDPNFHGKKVQGSKVRRRRSKEDGLNFTLFSSIINQLGEDSEVFIHHLKDDSRTFVAESSIHFCKEDFRPVQTAYANACLQWVEKNRGNPKLTQYIVGALRDIGRNDVIESCELYRDETLEMDTLL